MRTLAVALALAVVLAPVAARADGPFDLVSGDFTWPGKMQVALHPFGGEAFLGGGTSFNLYRLDGEFFYKLYNVATDIDLWVGAQLGFAVTGDGGTAVLTPAPMAMVTFNTIAVPLVPYARAGLGLAFDTGGNTFCGGLRVGGGADYMVFRQMGFGLAVDFDFGGCGGGALVDILYGVGARYLF